MSGWPRTRARAGGGAEAWRWRCRACLIAHQQLPPFALGQRGRPSQLKVLVVRSLLLDQRKDVRLHDPVHEERFHQFAHELGDQQSTGVQRPPLGDLVGHDVGRTRTALPAALVELHHANRDFHSHCSIAPEWVPHSASQADSGEVPHLTVVRQRKADARHDLGNMIYLDVTLAVIEGLRDLVHSLRELSLLLLHIALPDARAAWTTRIVAKHCIADIVLREHRSENHPYGFTIRRKQLSRLAILVCRPATIFDVLGWLPLFHHATHEELAGGRKLRRL